MNHTVLIGRLVRDGELRFIPNSGQAIYTMTVAVDRDMSREKKVEAQVAGKPTADFIRVVVWGKQAEHCANYLSKGRQCAVQGSIQTGSYKTNQGETRYTTDIRASNVQFLGGGESQGNGGQSGDDFNFGNYNPDDFQAIEDNEEDIPF